MKDEGSPALIPGGYASASLVSHIMYEKYADALPLYRQEKGFELPGVSISRTTMANWIITCSQNYLKPIYDYFHRELLKRHFLMADETPIQVLKEPGRRPQNKSYIWLMRSGEDRLPPIILYHYTETRAVGNAADFLDGIDEGSYVMVDGYSGYNRLKKIRRCCCYAHIRRYLMEAIPSGQGKTTVIRQYREFFTVTSCLNTNEAIRQKDCPMHRCTNAARRMQSRLWKVSCAGSMGSIQKRGAAWIGQ